MFIKLFILTQLSLLLVPGPTDAPPGSTALTPLNNEPTPCPTEERGEQHHVE